MSSFLFMGFSRLLSKALCEQTNCPVGEASEEKILPISETKEITELATCAAVSEADIGRSLSSQLALELDTVGTSKGFEFVTASALISESKYDVEVSVTTQDTEHDMVISTSPSGGSEADIEGPLPAKDIHLDLPSTNFVCKDVEDSLPIKESAQAVAVALSPKESSEDTEVPLPNKEIVPESGYSASIDEINEADLVRPLLPELCSLSVSEPPVAVSELPALADPEHAITAVSGVSSLEPSVPILEPAVSVLQPVMIVSEPSVPVQEPTVAVSEPAVIVSEHTQITSPEMAVESSPVIVDSSVMSSQIMKGMNLLGGDENLGPEVGMQETLLHPGEEPRDGGHLKSDLYENVVAAIA